MATGRLGPARIAAGQKEIQETREDVKSIQQRLESVQSEVHEIHDLVQIPGAQERLQLIGQGANTEADA